jgi:hypothetical protein
VWKLNKRKTAVGSPKSSICPGVLAYGSTSKEAQAKVQALALRVVADRLDHGEADPDLVSISFAAV